VEWSLSLRRNPGTKREGMVKRITLDSSVIVSSLLEKEPRHKEAFEIWTTVVSGKYFAIMPYSVFVEVVAAVRRRTGSEKLAREVKLKLLNIETISFVALDDKSANQAADLAAKIGVRGMDALVIQVSREFDTELASFDEEMMAKAAELLS
jgi:predicted nucleic acid-binding protein